jgi:hypothetical protein
MVYEVVLPASGNRFEFERDEPLEVDEYFTPLNLMYKVLRIKPGNGYDAVVEVEHVAGPPVNLPREP